MSYQVFPPEWNSYSVYTGPGSASLTASAAAWGGLAEDLGTTATSVAQVISSLASSFQGPSSTALTAAVAPYVTWLTNTAAQAAQVGQQAAAQAALYEAVHAAVVPPALIEANRALLLALIATNFFGQNATAIAACEAQYMGYWAQDGGALDAYNAATQTNVSQTEPPTSPAPVSHDTTPPPMAAQQPMTTSVPPAMEGGSGSGWTPTPGSFAQMLQGLGVPGDLSWLNNIQVSAVSSAANLGSVPARFAMTPVSMLMQLARMGGMGATAGAAGLAGSTSSTTTTLMESIGQFVDGKLQGAVGTLAGHFTSATNAISAKLSQAASLGQLRVPEAWSSAAQATLTRSVPVLPSAVVSAPTAAAQGFPGGGFGQALMGALSGRGISNVAAKAAPKVVPKPSAGG